VRWATGHQAHVETTGPQPRVADGQQRRLWCCAIASKRYMLYALDAHGCPDICKYSEHGLGHLLNPMDPDDEIQEWTRWFWDGVISETASFA
jgi:hypothetical protein